MSDPKLKGGSLLYVLMMALVISGILGAYLWNSYYQRIWLDRLQSERLAEINLRSGLERYLAGYPNQGESVVWDLYGRKRDSVWIERSRWGLFDLLSIRSHYLQAEGQSHLLVGQRLPKSYQCSLFLGQTRDRLTLAGGAVLKGKVYLSPAGWQPGYVDRVGFTGRVEAVVKTRPRDTLALATDKWGEVAQLLNWCVATATTGQSFVVEDEQLVQLWDNSAQRIEVQGNLDLVGCQLLGKVLVTCTDTLRVWGSCELDQAILAARYIELKAGVAGRVQAFATHGLVLDSMVSLSYPSVLVTWSPASYGAQLSLGPNCRLEGGAIFQKQGSSHPEDYVYLASSSQIWGALHAKTNLDLRGRVQGMVITQGFLVKTAAARYRNRLFGGKIDFEALSTDFVSPWLYPKAEAEVVEFLEDPVVEDKN